MICLSECLRGKEFLLIQNFFYSYLYEEGLWLMQPFMVLLCYWYECIMNQKLINPFITDFSFMNTAKAKSKNKGITQTSRRKSLKNKKTASKQADTLKSVLTQIQSLTNQIQSLNKTQSSISKLSKPLRSSSQNLTFKNGNQISEYTQYPILLSEELYKSQYLQRKSPCSIHCSSQCHQLAKDFEEMVKKNKQLEEENEELQKRLYFESKEKRKLRWKLQKDEKQKIQKEFMNYTQNLDISSSIKRKKEEKTRKNPHLLRSTHIRNQFKNIDDSLILSVNLDENKENNGADYEPISPMRASEDKNKIKKDFIRKQLREINEKIKSVHFG